MTDPIRDREELQRAHDILVAVAAGKASSFFPVDARQEFVFAIDVLCWALRHDHNKRFAERLTGIKARLNSQGIELTALTRCNTPAANRSSHANPRTPLGNRSATSSPRTRRPRCAPSSPDTLSARRPLRSMLQS